EIALEKPDEWNPATIKMGEIDAAAKDPAPAIFRMVERAAAHDRDLGRGIERREIDRDLHGSERGLVLGVEETRILHGQNARLAAALEEDRAEIDRTIGRKLRQQFRRLRSRQQHRMAEVKARGLVGEHVGEKDALIDLDAVLVALQERTFGR